jgi:cyclopropane fatty-acyl-phospholipid synthase-like methyltransferase
MSSYYANENHRIQECQEAVNKANRVKKEQMELNTTTDQWREELERLGAKC